MEHTLVALPTCSWQSWGYRTKATRHYDNTIDNKAFINLRSYIDCSSIVVSLISFLMFALVRGNQKLNLLLHSAWSTDSWGVPWGSDGQVGVDVSGFKASRWSISFPTPRRCSSILDLVGVHPALKVPSDLTIQPKTTCTQKSQRELSLW